MKNHQLGWWMFIVYKEWLLWCTEDSIKQSLKSEVFAMRYPWIDQYLLAMPVVTKDLQAEWNWIRYQINGKMFAAICLDDATGKPVYITLKLDPAEGEFFR